MNKPAGSLADQLQALGVGKKTTPTNSKEKNAKSASDYRTKAERGPKVGDLEAEMAKKLADANAQSDDAGEVSTRQIKPAKRNACVATTTMAG